MYIFYLFMLYTCTHVRVFDKKEKSKGRYIYMLHCIEVDIRERNTVADKGWEK